MFKSSGIRKAGIDVSVTALGGALFIFVLAALVFFYITATDTEHDKEYISIAGELRVLSQSIVEDAVESSGANVEAFKQLKTTRNTFESMLTKLHEGEPEKGLPPSAEQGDVML